MTITGTQIRKGRELLGWQPTRLAKAARLPFNTVMRAELLGGRTLQTQVHADAIRQALELAGVHFDGRIRVDSDRKQS